MEEEVTDIFPLKISLNLIQRMKEKTTHGTHFMRIYNSLNY